MGPKNTIKRAQRTIKLPSIPSRLLHARRNRHQDSRPYGKDSAGHSQNCESDRPGRPRHRKGHRHHRKSRCKKAHPLRQRPCFASIKALVTAIAAGGWVAILAIVVICLIGLIAASLWHLLFW